MPLSSIPNAALDLAFRLNGTVRGPLVRGDDALAASRGWLEAGRSKRLGASPPTVAERPPLQEPGSSAGLAQAPGGTQEATA